MAFSFQADIKAEWSRTQNESMIPLPQDSISGGIEET
jgi:hypothetical protein